MVTLYLNKDMPVYKPEETVSGYVEVKLAAKSFTLRVSLIGRANVHWLKGNAHFLNEVNYFDNFNIPINYESKQVTSDGAEKYPFSIQLPENLPTSFENQYAKIIYSISAKLTNVPKSRDVEFKKTFYVLRESDLNMYASLHTGLKENGESARGMLCCKSEPIKIEFSTKKGGFVAGQTIDFTVKVENLTKNEIKGSCFCVELNQQTKVISKETASFSTIIQSVKCENSFAENSTQEWNGSIKIPVVAPSCWGKCSIITCNYFMDLRFKASFLSNEISIFLPIIIGTKPIQSDLKTPEASSYSLEKSIYTDNSAFKGVYKLNEIDFFTKKNKQTNLGPFYPFYSNF